MKPLLARWVLAGALVLGWTQSSTAFQKSNPDALPDFDRRYDARPNQAALARTAALEELTKAVPGARIGVDPLLGTPRWMRSRTGFLTSPRPGGALARSPAAGDPDVVREFLDQHQDAFGFGAGALAEAVLARDYTTAHNGLRTIVWRQALDGIEVFDGLLACHVTRDGRIAGLSSLFLPNLEMIADRSLPGRRAAQADPRVSPSEAMRLAAANLGDRIDPPTLRRILRRETPDLSQEWTGPGLPGSSDLRLVWLPLHHSAVRLCWQVVLTSGQNHRMYRLLIDALTGEVWLRQCLSKNDGPASYRVYASDSPSPFSPGHPEPLTNQPATTQRAWLTLSALDTNASPLGWIALGRNDTVGNNVDARLDRDGDDEPDLPRPSGDPVRVFDFPLDLSRAPSAYSQASVAQLFYWCNWAHDRLYQLGFTEAAGNFQADNFGRGGLAGDPLIADAQDGGYENNAMISVPPDGLAPRMQMFLFTGPDPDRDSAFDAEVVLHEYAHGLTDRMVGGGLGLFTWQSVGLAEGWSDFYALALLSEPGDDPGGNYASGGYLSYLLDGLTENYYYGIRRYPYSTNLQRNPLTFRDIDPSQAKPHPEAPLSPLHRPFDPDNGAEVHCIGEVWCAVLWVLRANLVARHGFEAGNPLALQLVTDALRLCPPNPDFIEARDAILLADLVNNDGGNLGDLWGAFARRGLGLHASSPGTRTVYGVAESFEAPGQLWIYPGQLTVSRGALHGPFQPAAQAVQIANLAAGTLNWTAGADSGLVAILPAAGSIPAGGVPQTVSLALDPAVGLLPAGTYTNRISVLNADTGAGQTLEWVLKIGQPDRLTEWFDSGNNDLAYVSLTFTPDNSESYYSLCATPAIELPVDPLGGRRIWPGDDGSVQVRLADGHRVGLFGFSTNVFYVSGNGYLTLGRGDYSYSQSLDTHFSLPRISALFADLDTEEGSGDVGVRELEDRVVVTYLGVSEYGRSSRSTFQIEWFYDGRIRITYLRVDARFGIVGLSRGEGLPAGFEPTDLSAADRCGLPLHLSLPEQAGESDGVLSGAGRVGTPSAPMQDLAVQLTADPDSALVLPASVLIPAGATNACFDIGLVDNLAIDGPRRPVVLARAMGYAAAAASLLVTDNESAAVQLDVPATAVEGGPALTGLLRLSEPAEAPLLAYLFSGSPARLSVPACVVVQPGQTEASFLFQPLDDGFFTAEESVQVTAIVTGWPAAAATIRLSESQPPGLDLSLPQQALETQGLWRQAGRVRLSGRVGTNLVVRLLSLRPDEIAVSPTVTVPAGASAAAFDLDVRDDGLPDGPQQVAIVAEAAGYNPATNAMMALDIGSPPLPAQPEPTDGAIHVPVTTSLRWKAESFEAMVNGGFERGDLSGWTLATSGPVTAVSDDGTIDPQGNDAPLAPAEGSTALLLTSGHESGFVLTQDVTLPEGCDSLVLSWAQCVRQTAFDSGYGTYRVEIRNTNDVVLQRAFYGDLGNFWNNVWGRWTADLSELAGEKVLRVVFVLEARSGRLNVRLDEVSLKLGRPAGGLWDVYLGAGLPLGPGDLAATTTQSQWQPPTLNPLTTYYWQIAARSGGVTPGPVWQFATRGPERFEWTTIASPQYLDRPFPAAIRARDELGRTVTNFHGTVSLTARSGTDVALFREGFESGLAGWDQSDHNYVYETTTETAALGARSLRITGGCYSPCTGLARSFAGLTPDRFSFRVRAASAEREGAHLRLMDSENSPGLPFFMQRDGTMGIYQYREGRIFWYSVPYEADRWYKITLACDWSLRTFDFCVDDAVAHSRIPIPPEIYSVRRLFLYNSDNTTTWWDQIEFLQGPAPRSVPLLPVQTAAFTNGLWAGQIRVQEPAPEIRLTARDDLGYSGESGAFVVAPWGDIGIVARATSDPVPAGAAVAFEAIVTNSGPAAATGVVVTSSFPAHVTLSSPWASLGACRLAGQSAVFDFGSLPASGVATGRVVAVAHATIGITNVATVVRADLEAWHDNNTATAQVAVLPSLTIGSVSIVEGDHGLRDVWLPVVLSSATDRDVSVSCALGDGTAEPGYDFFFSPTRLVFPPGTISNGIPIQIRGDLDLEPDEVCRVRLGAETNVFLAGVEGACTIVTDDSTTGKVRRFVFDPVGSPQQLNEPVPLAISAVDAGGKKVNDYDGRVSLGLIGPRSVRTVGGSPTLGLGFPLAANYPAHRSQVLYLQSEIGGPGRIVALGLYVQSVPGQIVRNFTVRLRHTAAVDYRSGQSWVADGWTIVCRTNWAITSPGWAMLELQTPFEYNGADNLLADFSISNPSASGAYGVCGGASTAMPRTLTLSAAATLGSPLAWTGPTPAGNITYSVPDLRLVFDTAIPAALSIESAGPFRAGAWNGGVAIREPGAGLAFAADDGSGHLGRSAAFDVPNLNDLSLAWQPAQPVRAGETNRFTLTLSNSGPAAATGVAATNSLPTGTRLVSASASQGTWSVAPDQIVFRPGTLAGGSSASLEFDLTMNRMGSATNRASVTKAEPEAYLRNNAADLLIETLPPCVRLDDISIFEGDSGPGEVAIPLRLTGASSTPIRVRYSVWGDQAELFQDFLLQSGEVLFAAGQTEAWLGLRLAGDAALESDETLHLYAWADLGDYCSDEMTITILNDDSPPVLTVTPITVTEGDANSPGQAVFELDLSVPCGLPVLVGYATADGTALAGADYLPASGIIDFPPFTTSRQIAIPLVGDSIPEPGEHFYVQLTAVTNVLLGATQAPCSIRDDDPGTEPGAIAWLDFTPVASPQFAGRPFSVMIAARTASGELAPSFSGVASLEGVCHESWTARLGLGDAWASTPFGYTVFGRRTQVFYPAAEIGSAATLQALTLNVVYTSDCVLSNFTIRVKHTESPVPPQSWEAEGWQTVFQADLPLWTAGRLRFPFLAPFAYDGTRNLLVDFTFKSPAGYSGSYCEATSCEVPAAIEAWTDDADAGDPLAWSGSLPKPQVSNPRPNIELDLARQTSVGVQPEIAGPFAAGLWSGDLAVATPAAHLVLVARDPNGRLGVSAPFDVWSSVDGDGDGLPDAWEVRFFGSCSHPDAAPAADPDRDGADNAHEFRSGTDPLDPGSSLRIESVRIEDGSARIVFQTVGGKRYGLEQSPGLHPPEWRPIEDPVIGTGGPVELRSVITPGTRFYRVRLLP